MKGRDEAESAVGMGGAGGDRRQSAGECGQWGGLMGRPSIGGQGTWAEYSRLESQRSEFHGTRLNRRMVETPGGRLGRVAQGGTGWHSGWTGGQLEEINKTMAVVISCRVNDDMAQHLPICFVFQRPDTIHQYPPPTTTQPPGHPATRPPGHPATRPPPSVLPVALLPPPP